MEAEIDRTTKQEPKMHSKIKETSGTSGKKTNKTKTKPLYFWNSFDVNKWLKKYGGKYFELYGDLLLSQEITGRTLIRMNDIKLERLGITSADHRREIIQHILRLRLKHEAIDLKNLEQKGTGFELRLPNTNRLQPPKVDTPK
ncbi:protein aveugle-like [Mytilus edulis]|uniref:protein aveugle-like n=1 Tax=Mytilus edulis TaxID=6550 RepID=UPI0039EE54EA